MAKVLYIVGNPNAEEQSFSLQVGKAFLDAYREAAPQDEIVVIDTYAVDIPFIDADVLGAWGALRSGADFASLTAEQQAKVARLNELVDQFADADKYVFVTPLWNFSIPPKVKMYIDAVSVAGKTFKYTEQGPVGLLGDKRIVHIQARGGVYSEGPMAALEMGDKYLRAVTSLFGITDFQSVIVEGHAYAPQNADVIKAAAIENAQAAAKQFAQDAVKA